MYFLEKFQKLWTHRWAKNVCQNITNAKNAYFPCEYEKYFENLGNRWKNYRKLKLVYKLFMPNTSEKDMRLQIKFTFKILFCGKNAKHGSFFQKILK